MAIPERLYRYIELREFLRIVTSGKMSLTLITTWDDPYETDALRHLASLELEKTLLAEPGSSPAESARAAELRAALRQEIVANATRVFAQCWTKCAESDGLWRAYSKDQLGVRITVNGQVVKDAIERALGYCRPLEVEYLELSDAQARVVSEYAKNDMRITLEECCRYKRRAFEYEAEYRFCHAPKSVEVDLGPFHLEEESGLQRGLEYLRAELARAYGPNPQRLPYDFDLASILEVTVDPRLSAGKDGWWIETLQRLCEKCGMVIKLTHSNLYQRP